MEPTAASHALLTDPAEFEAYLARVSGRLHDRWTERCAFLEAADRRLQNLAHLSATVRDEALTAELEALHERARHALATLRDVGPHGVWPTATPSDPSTPAAAAEATGTAPEISTPALETLSPAPETQDPIPETQASEPESNPVAPVDAGGQEQDWHTVLQRFWTAPPGPPPTSPTDPVSGGDSSQVPSPADAEPPAGANPFASGIPDFAATSSPPTGNGQAHTSPPPASLPPTSSPAFLGWDLDIRVTPETTNPAPGTSASEPELAGVAEPASGNPTLRLSIAIGEQQKEWSFDGEIAVIGRRDAAGQNRPELDLWPDQAVSRRHAQIARRNDRFYFVDLGSANGTQLNGEPLPSHAEHPLAEGDEITIGELTTLVVLPTVLPSVLPTVPTR